MGIPEIMQFLSSCENLEESFLKSIGNANSDPRSNIHMDPYFCGNSGKS